MRKVIGFIVSTVITLLVSSCRFNNNSHALDSWQGKYTYEEDPIKATAGYHMVMQWQLDIQKEAAKYVANLEINGQQTYVKLQCEVVGNEKAISLLYSKNIGTSSEDLQPGDTLFRLSKEGNDLITVWAILEPKLAKKPLEKM